MHNLIAKPKDRYLLFTLLGMAVLLIFAYGWAPGGLDVDSCNYAVVAKEILRTGRWLKLYDPVYEGVFYYHFPLCIWMTAIFFKILGTTAFAAKLFSMLCAVSLAGVIFYFGKLLKNQWVGFFAGVSLLMTNSIVRLARQSRMDLPAALFITLAIFSFILAQRRSRRYYLLFGLFTSLAIMSKDVFGTAPLAIVFIYLVIFRKYRELLSLEFILGVITAIAPVLLWIWLDAKTLIVPWFYWNFLHLLKAQRFYTPWHYYITALVTKYFYFLFFAIYGGYLAVGEARQQKKDEFYLLIIWALIFPLAFSFGRQRLHYFILPMYPATALLAGMAFDKIFKEPLKLRIAAGLKYILIAGALIVLSFPLNMRSKRFNEAVAMSPVIDRLLKQLSDYEFIVYKYDRAAVLFYSQELTRVKAVNNQASLEEVLSAPRDKPRIVFISEEDFQGLEPSRKENFRVVLKYKDKILIASKDAQLSVVLP